MRYDLTDSEWSDGAQRSATPDRAQALVAHRSLEGIAHRPKTDVGRAEIDLLRRVAGSSRTAGI
jgi:hypothetical protein